MLAYQFGLKQSHSTYAATKQHFCQQDYQVHGQGNIAVATLVDLKKAFAKWTTGRHAVKSGVLQEPVRGQLSFILCHD